MADPKSLARLPQITSRMKRALNMKVSTNERGYGIQFKISGFKYDDFDRSGYLSAMKVNRMLETGRFVSSGLTKLSLQSTSNSKTMFYVLGSHISFSLELYRRASTSLPMVFTTRLSNIGRTSLDECQTIHDESMLPPGALSSDVNEIKAIDASWDNAFLARRILRVVNIDPRTLRPVPFEEEMRQSLSDIVSSASSSGDTSSFPSDVKLSDKVPAEHYSCELTVRYDDLDCYFHANQGSYLTYVAECAAHASAAGALKNFSGDTSFRNISQIITLYSAETLPGDRLKVSTWEDKEDKNALYFLITKDGTTVFRSKFVYFPSVDL